MLNFLEKKNKKQVVCEYILRVGIYLSLFVFLSSLMLIAFFAPSFFFVKYKDETIQKQLESINQTNLNKAEDPIAAIKNINKFSTIFPKENTQKNSYKDIIDKIISLKNNNIKIYYINIEQGAKNKKIIVNGVANTREGLTTFNNSLKTDGFFSEVSFPVTDFIKSSNADFTATLTL